MPASGPLRRPHLPSQAGEPNGEDKGEYQSLETAMLLHDRLRIQLRQWDPTWLSRPGAPWDSVLQEVIQDFASLLESVLVRGSTDESTPLLVHPDEPAVAPHVGWLIIRFKP
jgi:hypothetical protein